MVVPWRAEINGVGRSSKQGVGRSEVVVGRVGAVGSDISIYVDRVQILRVKKSFKLIKAEYSETLSRLQFSKE